MEYERIINELEKDYLVEDILHKDIKIIFVLESPHVQELKYQAPVSGSSGKSMTKHLLGEAYDLPLGRVLKEKNGVPPFDTIGLMNICQIPMQSKAYQHPQVESTYHTFFQQLEKVRTSNQKNSFKEEELNQLQQTILHRFQKRLSIFKDEGILFVPCGRFAEKFFRLASGSDGYHVLTGVPHPSYNSWDKERYKEVIEK